MPALVTVAPGLLLSGAGGAWLEHSRAFVIADVHIGYARAARRRGGYLPIAETAEHAAERVLRATQTLGATRLIIAGDLRHSTRDADDAEHAEVRAFLQRVCAAGQVTLVPGNHDRGAAALYGRDVEVADGPLVLHDVTIAHAPPDAPPARWTVCGHLHPSTVVRDETGAGARYPCALVGSRVVVLPAFSGWAGGVTSGRLRRSLFPGRWTAYPIAGGEVFSLAGERG